MILLLVCLFKLLFVFVITCFAEHSTLEFVVVIHRHGDRTPLFTYPNVIYSNKSYWPDGWGQLTKQGKMRMFELGKHVRERYKHFLTYNPREVYIRSSDVDRCLESTALIMAGAYPPQDRWKWSEEVNWLPFPIHTVPKNEDGMLYSSSDCPKAEEEKKRIVQSYDYQKRLKSFQQLFSNLSSKLGSKISNLLDASFLLDTLFIEKYNSYSLPEWVTEDTFDQLKQLQLMYFQIVYSSKVIQKLRAGLLLKDVHDKFMQHISQFTNGVDHNQEFSNLKLAIYSTHDCQIIIFLKLLNRFNDIAPPFGASILIELYSINNRSKYFLKFHYLNDTSSMKSFPFYPSCCHSDHCDIYSFFDCFQLIQDWKKECFAETFYLGYYLLPTLFIVLVGIYIYRKFVN